MIGLTNEAFEEFLCDSSSLPRLESLIEDIRSRPRMDNTTNSITLSRQELTGEFTRVARAVEEKLGLPEQELPTIHHMMNPGTRALLRYGTPVAISAFSAYIFSLGYLHMDVTDMKLVMGLGSVGSVLGGASFAVTSFEERGKAKDTEGVYIHDSKKVKVIRKPTIPFPMIFAHEYAHALQGEAHGEEIFDQKIVTEGHASGIEHNHGVVDGYEGAAMWQRLHHLAGACAWVAQKTGKKSEFEFVPSQRKLPYALGHAVFAMLEQENPQIYTELLQPQPLPVIT